MSIFGQGKPGVVNIGKYAKAQRNCYYKDTPMTYEMYELLQARDKIKHDYAEYMKLTIARLKAADAKIIKRAKEEGLDLRGLERS